MSSVPFSRRHCQSAPPPSTSPSSPSPVNVPPRIGTTRRSPPGAVPSERTSPTSAETRKSGASSSTRRSGEVREDLLPKETDRPQHPLLVHARPLQAEHHGGDAQALAVARDLLADLHGVADDE